jgi:hypothetical protein
MNLPSVREDIILKYYFDQIIYGFQIISEYKVKINKIIAPDFNCFEYINPDERMITKIIADLLKPYGGHGQEETFLRAFTRIILKDKKDLISLDKVIIRCESHTVNIEQHRRAIDLLIIGNDLACVVENKPWAKEQNNQLDDYFKHTYSLVNEPYIVFLTQDGHSSETFTQDGYEKFIQAAYCHKPNMPNGNIVYLEDWLDECIKLCCADKVRFFINNFKSWIKENL